MCSSYKAHSWKDNDAIECKNTAYKNLQSRGMTELFAPYSSIKLFAGGQSPKSIICSTGLLQILHFSLTINLIL